MNADPQLAGRPYNEIDTYMRGFGFDYTEHPNCTGGFGGHIDGVHAGRPQHGSPVITITPRSNSAGTNKRIQLIHSVDGASTGKGTIVDNIPLSDFENEWVQVREEVHYTHNGYYSCRITRISDGKLLVDFRDDDIDMWRIGSSYIRTKFGLYRGLAGGMLDRDPVGQSPLLKNESLWVTDFRIYEKNPNPTPGVPHN